MKNDTMAPTKNRDIARSRMGWFRIQPSNKPISDHIQAATWVKALKSSDIKNHLLDRMEHTDEE